MCYSVVSLLTQSTEVPASGPQEQVATSSSVDSYTYPTTSVPYSPAPTSSGYSSYSASPNGSPEHSPNYDPLLDIDLALTPSPEDPFRMVQTDPLGISPKMCYPDNSDPRSFRASPEYCPRASNSMEGCSDPMYSTVMAEPNTCFPQFTAGLENSLQTKNYGMVHGPNFFFSNYPQGIEMSQIFKRCKICGDMASGNHFGVQSCEACKSFFRRSVRANSRYACRGNRNCAIEKHTRNRCQYCRLQKCASHGMRKEAVQEERNPFAVKIQSAPNTASDSCVYNSLPNFKVELNCSPDSTVSDEVLVNADKSVQSEEAAMITSPTIKSAGNHFEILKNSLLKVIEWAKRIPAFVSLSREDQVTLLEACWQQVLAFILASQSESTTMIGAASDELTSWLNNLGADKVERACLKGLLLFNQDAKGLSPASQRKVEVFQEQILLSLETRTKTVYSDSPRRFSKLLLRLGSLKAVSLSVVQHMGIQKALNNVKLSVLVGELL